MIVKFLGDTQTKSCGVCGRHQTKEVSYKCYYTVNGRFCFNINEKKEVPDDLGNFLLSLNTEKVIFEKC